MKRRNFHVILCFVIILLCGCGGTKNAEKIGLRTQQIETLKNVVDTKSYTIEVNTAYPMQTYAVTRVTNALLQNTGNSASRINVNGNFIEVKNDSIKGVLSYFGEVRTVNSYNPRDGGINFEGLPTTYEVTENEKKQTLNIEFDIKNKIEPYNVIIQLYPDKSATVIVNSPYRTSIRYDGTLKPSEVEENL